MTDILKIISKEIVRALLSAAARQQVSQMKYLGLSPISISALSDCGSSVSAILEDQADDFYSLDIHESKLNHMINISKSIAARNHIKIELIKRGAPRELMQKLYQMSPKEITNIKNELGLKGDLTGRCYVSDDDESRIKMSWATYAECEVPERYIRVSDALEINVLRIWKIVGERKTAQVAPQQSGLRSENHFDI